MALAWLLYGSRTPPWSNRVVMFKLYIVPVLAQSYSPTYSVFYNFFWSFCPKQSKITAKLHLTCKGRWGRERATMSIDYVFIIMRRLMTTRPGEDKANTSESIYACTGAGDLDPTRSRPSHPPSPERCMHGTLPLPSLDGCAVEWETAR